MTDPQNLYLENNDWLALQEALNKDKINDNHDEITHLFLEKCNMVKRAEELADKVDLIGLQYQIEDLQDELYAANATIEDF